ncbi:hypothetical protein EJB05_19223 [Eragrostis curvula]|uniref:HTH myb-type domain-containing protein n=1 Tax=Eragrostis curvula TaxID=38414 RepID=A0A5J9UVW7_9POAL|nr:hypothetical protein EJB05_19223 [Eragrostis curvula]
MSQDFIDGVTDAKFLQTDMETAYSHTSPMNQLHNGRVSTCRSLAVTLVPALSEGTFPSFPVHQPSYVERELPDSSITSFSASLAALQSTCKLPSNFTSSDLHIYNESQSPNGKISSGPYATGQFDHDTQLPPTYPSFKSNSSSLRMILPNVSERIRWSQEPLQGVFDCSQTVYFSNQQNVNPVGKQIQDSVTMNPDTQLADRNECYSSGGSVQLLGSAESMLKNSMPITIQFLQAVDARSLTPENYSYCQVRSSVPPFNYDEVSIDNLPSSNATPTKLRMRWTPELHEQFVEAVNMLGGSESRKLHLLFFVPAEATPKAIQKVLKVKGLTIYHVKSHLQKYRAVQHRPESSDAGASAKRSSLMDEAPFPQLKGLKNVEGLRTQIGLQKQLYEQLEVQRKLQLQVEEHSKYLEMIIAKQSESLKKLGALPGCQDRSQTVLSNNKACEEQDAMH